mgnify:CR=1 FL=1
MKTLNEQYRLIKEDKGHKGMFLTEAKRQFPNYIRNAATFDEAEKVLKRKGVITENFTGLEPINSPFSTKVQEPYETAFAKFLEEAKSPEIKAKEVKAKVLKSQEDDEKAELKTTSKQVENDLEHGYDNVDDKNIDNLIFSQVMTGYYAEMKDPKNADKTMEQLKDIVLKNLAKDPIFYTKDGQFGVKGLGYTTEAPGLGTPKEAKGKYKASGYGDLKESLEEQKIRKAIRSIVSEELNSESIGKNYPDKISGEYEGKSVLFPGADLYNLLRDTLEISISEDDFVDKIAYALTDETSDLLSQDEHKLRTWYDKNQVALNPSSSQLINKPELNENVEDHYASIIDSNNMSEEDAYYFLEDQGLNQHQIDSIIDQAFPDNMDEVNQMININTSNTKGGGGKRFVPTKFAFPNTIRKRFGDHIVFSNGTLYVSAILFNNLVKGYANHPSIKKLLMDVPMPIKQMLNKVENYDSIVELPKQYKTYHPFKATVEKSTEDKFNKAGDKQYWSVGDLLIPNLMAGAGVEKVEESKLRNVISSIIRQELNENVDKRLKEIEAEAAMEAMGSKMEKIMAEIEKRNMQLGKLDEDEDLKSMMDKGAIKKIQKEIKLLQKAQAKIEKILGKGKGKKVEVIDELEDLDELAEKPDFGLEEAKKKHWS